MKQRKRYSYKEDLLADLKDPDYAAGYLSAAMSESVETFLLAIRNVADAQKGMTRVASEAHVNRENLYRMLSEDGNPRLSSLHAVLNTLGFRISIQTGPVVATISQEVPIETPATFSAVNTNTKTQTIGAHSSGRTSSDKRQTGISRLYTRQTPTAGIYPSVSTQLA